ncbi:hypothetical protein ACFSKW_38285 [Nonomuraea mangrovi]|uniref:Uncharacterized protein n=1 Tax=Nonomuraea mangrovi TaxID=2316207 RepID=A0ABW4T896_9ACTN
MPRPPSAPSRTTSGFSRLSPVSAPAGVRVRPLAATRESASPSSRSAAWLSAFHRRTSCTATPRDEEEHSAARSSSAAADNRWIADEFLVDVLAD